MTQYKIVVDCTSGKQEYIELTPAEIAQRDQEIAQLEEQKAIRDAEAEAKEALKASARAKLVAGEKLTEDEAAVLVI